MTNVQIDNFLQKNRTSVARVKVTLKTRKPFVGIFLKMTDYDELKSKNFWRVIGEANLESYERSKDLGLARIFSGGEITKLSVVV